nr:unnamed protein product [Digitaria exilis]
MGAATEAMSPAAVNSMVIGAAGLTAFEPCAWGDFFINYAPPFSQESEERMRERACQLKAELRRRMSDAGEAMSVAGTVTMVDTLERLGVDCHFRDEIAAALRRVVVIDDGESLDDGDLRLVALRFRLLRQHGIWVPADVFDRFRDETGSFSESLSSDPGSLLSLYNAAHMATPGEQSLDEAISFSRSHLESMRGKLASPMAEQVSRALDIPLPRLPKRIETMHYVVEYEKEDGHDPMVLELARLDFNLVRSLHLKELRDLSLWWKELYGNVNLSYARDRLVENYFWTCGVFHEEDYSRARMLFAKTFGLLSLMDDTYDVYATLEDCHVLNEAIQRWDESAASTLPEYMRMFYINLVRNFQGFEDSLQPHEKYRVSYAKKAFKLSSKYYLDEARWSSENYAPSFKEHVEVSVMSSGFPTLAVVLLMGAGDLATKEAFDWAIDVPDVVSASGEVARFLNDIASYKKGKNKKDAASSVECYAKERGVSGEEAAAAIAGMAEHAWRTINGSCVEMDAALLPAAKLVVNLTKTLEVIYLGGRDAYTFAGDLKDLVVSLFVDGPAI